MSVKFKTAFGEQSSLFYVMLALMLLFFFTHLVTDYLHLVGATPSQVGGDLAKDAFQGLMLVQVAVAKAGGESLASKLRSTITAPDPEVRAE